MQRPFHVSSTVNYIPFPFRWYGRPDIGILIDIDTNRDRYSQETIAKQGAFSNATCLRFLNIFFYNLIVNQVVLMI
jgi:hypothetical protein